jgi:hypothetical protein
MAALLAYKLRGRVRGMKVVRRVVGLSVLTLLLVASDCNSSANPTLTVVREARNAAGVLTGLTVEGKGFSANGPVHLSFFFRKTTGGLISVVPPTAPAKDIRADGSGSFQFAWDRLECPRLEEGERGSWLSVIANDENSGKSGVGELHRGRESDCVHF